MNKLSANQLKVFTDPTFEDNLKAEGITFSNLPTAPETDSIVSAKTRAFTEEDVSQLAGQQATIREETTLESVFDDPILVEDLSKLQDVLADQMLFLSEYKYWEYDIEGNRVVYNQVVDGRTIYQNKNAQIVFTLNDQGEIISYRQTKLENFQEVAKGEKDILQPMQALESLYKSRKLPPQSKIIGAELGYHTYVQLTESQVLTPTWNFVVERDKERNNYLVNAYNEGQVIEVTPEEK